MNAIETLISVLCGPEGKCCISGSDDDRRLIDSALAELAQAAQPAPAGEGDGFMEAINELDGLYEFQPAPAAQPAQPAAEPSRFGSPELQAMIIARCVEKDQADSVQEDAALWHWLAECLVGTRTDLDDKIVASETVNDLKS